MSARLCRLVDRAFGAAERSLKRLGFIPRQPPPVDPARLDAAIERLAAQLTGCRADGFSVNTETGESWPCSEASPGFAAQHDRTRAAIRDVAHAIIDGACR